MPYGKDGKYKAPVDIGSEIANARELLVNEETLNVLLHQKPELASHALVNCANELLKAAGKIDQSLNERETMQESQEQAAEIAARRGIFIDVGAKLPINYSRFVEGLFKKDPTEQALYMHAAAGISGEAGEIIDCVKKFWVYNKPLDKENLLEELGDIFFYMQKIMNLNGWSIEDVLQHNVLKLMKRYPEGYSDQAAQARADKSA